MTKLTIIGAGSTVFTKNIVVDLLTIDQFKKIEIALMDIDKKRLIKTKEVLEIISKKMGVTPKISIHTNRKEALIDTEFVQTTIQVGGYKPSTVIDFEIPKKFGLNQTIADTLGVGGIMRSLRTIPVLLDIAEDINQICSITGLNKYQAALAKNRKFSETIITRLNNQEITVLESRLRQINLTCTKGSRFYTIHPNDCLLYTSPSPRDGLLSRMPSSA